LELVSKVTALFADIDKKVAEFQLKSGLRCPKMCGACCPSAKVQTTILEMLPAAQEILRRDAAAFWLDRISNQTPSNRCVFYQTQPAPEASGHCEFYPWRPSVCRLFGYAAVRTRQGKSALAACKQLKQTAPDDVVAAMALEIEAPCFTWYGTRIYGLDPVLGTKLFPINMALSHAVERMGLQMHLAYHERLVISDTAA
jgi:Fe-S-cluster containining protein